MLFVTTTSGQIVMKFMVDILGSQRMAPNASGHSLDSGVGSQSTCCHIY